MATKQQLSPQPPNPLPTKTQLKTNTTKYPQTNPLPNPQPPTTSQPSQTTTTTITIGSSNKFQIQKLQQQKTNPPIKERLKLNQPPPLPPSTQNYTNHQPKTLTQSIHRSPNLTNHHPKTPTNQPITYNIIETSIQNTTITSIHNVVT